MLRSRCHILAKIWDRDEITTNINALYTKLGIPMTSSLDEFRNEASSLLEKFNTQKGYQVGAMGANEVHLLVDYILDKYSKNNWPSLYVSKPANTSFRYPNVIGKGRRRGCYMFSPLCLKKVVKSFQTVIQTGQVLSSHDPDSPSTLQTDPDALECHAESDKEMVVTDVLPDQDINDDNSSDVGFDTIIDTTKGDGNLSSNKKREKRESQLVLETPKKTKIDEDQNSDPCSAIIESGSDVLLAMQPATIEPGADTSSAIVPVSIAYSTEQPKNRRHSYQGSQDDFLQIYEHNGSVFGYCIIRKEDGKKVTRQEMNEYCDNQMEVITAGNVRSFHCRAHSDCKKIFEKKSHMRDHVFEAYFKITCNVCGAVIKYFNNISKHMKLSHYTAVPNQMSKS